MSDLHDPARLDALRATGLSAASDEVLDDYTRLVSRLLDVPVALVSLVEDRRQVFPGLTGLGGEAEALRQTPMSHSVCQRVVVSAEPLVIPDTGLVPDLRDSPAVTDLGVVAYLGMPLVAAGGEVLGALCAIDREARQWTDADVATMSDLAQAVTSELRLRAANARSRELLAEVARAAARATLLADVSDVLVNTFDPEEGLAALARAVVPVLADWAVVDAVRGEELWRVEVAHRDRELPADVRRRRLPPAGALSNPLAGVVRGTTPVQHLTAVDLPGLGVGDPLGGAQLELFRELGADDVLLLGLQARGAVLGAITLVRTGPWSFSAEDRETAVDIAHRAALAIDNSRLYAEQRSAAETLQAGLTPTLPDLADGEIAARYLPASSAAEVGGDWYDAFLLPLADSGDIVIGDVVGHDLAAATQMGELRNLLRALAVDRLELPDLLVQRLDRVLAALEEERLATLVVGRVDRDDERAVSFTWTNAGHPPPVLALADGSARVLDDPAAEGPMLGVAPDLPRGVASAPLPPGSTLLLYTDGLVERRDTAIDDRVGQLCRAVAALATAPLDVLLDRVVEQMVGSRHDDDVALLAFRPH